MVALTFFFFFDGAVSDEAGSERSDVEEEEAEDDEDEASVGTSGMGIACIAFRIFFQSFTDRLSHSKSKNRGEVLIR